VETKAEVILGSAHDTGAQTHCAARIEEWESAPVLNITQADSSPPATYSALQHGIENREQLAMQVVNTELKMPSAHNASFLSHTRAIGCAVRRLAHEAQKDLEALAFHVLRLSRVMFHVFLERAMGFEPMATRLGSEDSPTELRPLTESDPTQGVSIPSQEIVDPHSPYYRRAESQLVLA
jgi:hypothetical protein